MAENRCKECDEHVREIAQLADLIAFWAYQAKWYYARYALVADYDSLNRMQQAEIDMVFERHRIAENRERHSHAEAPREIGS